MKRILEKYHLDWADVLYLLAMTVIGLAIRGILRVVTTVDWEMYWDPWIADCGKWAFPIWLRIGMTMRPPLSIFVGYQQASCQSDDCI